MDKQLPNRHSIRLKNYDYSNPGFYFITICTQNRKHLFGAVRADSISARNTDSISAHNSTSAYPGGNEFPESGGYGIPGGNGFRPCGGEMKLNDAGEMILAIWNKIPQYFANIKIDEFAIMPNHVHGIIQIAGNRAEIDSAPPYGRIQYPPARTDMEFAPTVGTVVQMFKRYTTIEYIKMVKQNIVPPFERRIWQRNYWEYIVRNENELHRIREYIIKNPEKWALDKLNGGTGNLVMETTEKYMEEPWMV